MHVYMYVQASDCKSQGEDMAATYCAGASDMLGETVKVIRRVKYFSICDVCFSENRNPLSGLSARSDVKCVFFSKARNKSLSISCLYCVQQVKAQDMCDMYCSIMKKYNLNKPEECMSDSHCPGGVGGGVLVIVFGDRVE